MIPSYVNYSTGKRGALILTIVVGLIFPGLCAFSHTLSLDELTETIQTVYDRTADFRADFVQDSIIRSMGKSMREEGTVYLKKPERMLWDYTVPSKKKLVINPRKAWLYVPEEKIVYVQDAKTVLSSKMTIRFLTGMGHLTKDFVVSLPPDGSTDGDGNYQILLTPRGYQAGIKQLLLVIDSDTFHIKGCVFTDLYDNETRLTFSNIKFNTNPPDELFDFVPPPGIDVQVMGSR